MRFTVLTLVAFFSLLARLSAQDDLFGNLVEKKPARKGFVIGANGTVEGDISGQQADIMGKVNGTIKVKELLQLKGGSQVNGNLYATKLQIEPTASFNGQCHMNTGASSALNAQANGVADRKSDKLVTA